MRRQLPPEGGAHAGSRPEQWRHRVDPDLDRALGGNQGDLAVGRQFAVQLGAALGVAAYTAVMTWAILKAVDATLGLRVAGQQESQGLDLALHDEAGYRL